MIHELSPSASYDEAHRAFRDTFFDSVNNGRLASFREHCVDLVFGSKDYRFLPYAFSNAARSYLHDVNSWTWSDSEATYIPKSSLISSLDTLLSSKNAINCRDNYYLPIVAGLREYVLENRPAAFRHFAAAAQFEDFYRVVKCDLGGGASFAKTYPDENDLAAARGTLLASRLPKFALEFSSKPDLIIFVSFDRIYMRAFGSVWIDTVAALGLQNVGLHFHVMEKGDVDMELVNQLAKRAKDCDIQLSISYEGFVNKERSYYASARFLVGGVLLEHFGRPMLICDADAIIDKSDVFRDVHLPKMLAENRVLGFISHAPWNGYLPWRKFSATWMFCPNTKEAAEFLNAAGDAIEYFWDVRQRNWWIDQVGLECARYTVTQRPGYTGKFSQIHEVLPNLLATGEAYKMRCISALPEMDERLKKGYAYWEALREVQTPS